MITYIGPGDIFYMDTQYVVCPVNTVGVMGNGLAVAFKLKCPWLFPEYLKACKGGALYKEGFCVIRGVVCLATKRNWKNPSTIQYIRTNVKKLAAWCRESGVASIAIPALGCGKGKIGFGKYDVTIGDVLTVLHEEFEDHPTEVWFLTSWEKQKKNG